MNSSKKIMNQQTQEKDAKKEVNVSVPEKKLKKKALFSGVNLKPIILVALTVAIVLVLCIGVGIQSFKPKVVVTIGKTDITMDDMMYPIYEMESQYLPLNEMYETYYGTSVWEAEYTGEDVSVSGLTNSIAFKQQVLNSEIEYEILYQRAVMAKYKLTEDEKKEAAKDAKEELKDLSWSQKLQLNITEKNLTERFEKRALADKYKDDEQEKLNKNVDEDSIIASVSKTAYRQYDIQYYYGSLNTYDENGNAVAMSDKDKKALTTKINDIAKKAKTEKDFTKLIGDKEEDITFVEDEGFTEQDGWSYVSEDNLKKIKKMKNGEISEAILDEKAGYYVVVKMIDNNSKEAYQTACDEAVASAQNEEYQTWFDKIATSYNYKVKDIWSDEVTIGSMTTDIVTAEDLEEMSEDSEETNGSAE